MDKLAQAGTSNDELNNQASTAQGDPEESVEESELAVRIRAALTVHTLTTLTHTQNTFTTPKDKLAQGDHLEESERVVRMRAALTHITAALTQAESRETDLNIANTKVKTLEATIQQLKDSLQAVSQGRKTTEVYKLTTLHCTHTLATLTHTQNTLHTCYYTASAGVAGDVIWCSEYEYITLSYADTVRIFVRAPLWKT